MKSKTSCFNWTIFKKNVTHYWPIWMLYLAYLLMTMPVTVWQMSTVEYSKEIDKLSRMYNVMQTVVRGEIFPYPTFIISAVAALAVFSYLYSAKSANMIHALPVNRLELYITNYLSGLAFLIIPQIIAFLATVIVCLMNEITCIQYLFYGTLAQMGTAFFAYSLAVFVAMFTGQTFAMPFYFVIVNYLYVGCMYLVSEIIVLLTYGVVNAWNPGKSCILSPLYYLGNNLRCETVYDEATNTVTGVQIHGMYLVGIYAVAAAVLIAAAYQLYKRRQIETSGDWVSISIVKPVFRWGAALCGGVLLAIAFTSLVSSACSVSIYPCVLFFMAVMGFLCFFAAEMLLEKNFRVFKKRRLLEWVGFTAAAMCFITMFELDVFGIEKRIPAEDEIEAAFVNMDYPLQVAPEDIPTLLAMHEQTVEHKKEYQQSEKQGEGFYYTTFRYYLKDGTMLERRYPLPVAEQYITDETTPTGWILTLECRPENLMQNMFGVDYGENDYVSGQIDLYNEQGDVNNYGLDKEELSRILSALEQDVREGHFESGFYSVHQGNTVEYYNSISLDYYSPIGDNDNWTYYYMYRSFMKDEDVYMGRAYRNNTYLSFGPECTNLIRTLEELGITDDTWHLYTYDEYETLNQEIMVSQ